MPVKTQQLSRETLGKKQSDVYLITIKEERRNNDSVEKYNVMYSTLEISNVKFMILS